VTGPDITTEDIAAVYKALEGQARNTDKIGRVLHLAAPHLYARWVAAELRHCARVIGRGDLYGDRTPVVEYLYNRATEAERLCAEPVD
jgi:hypothetical protein